VSEIKTKTVGDGGSKNETAGADFNVKVLRRYRFVPSKGERREGRKKLGILLAYFLAMSRKKVTEEAS
jgi:hypothetical protein